MLTDEQIARTLQEGQHQHLALLVERHFDALTGYLYRLTNGDKQLAEDLAQESFWQMFHKIAQYQHPRPFKPWLYTIATNLARNHYQSADSRHTEDESGLEALIEPESPETLLLAQDNGRFLHQALQALPAQQRETVILRYFEELSLAEIATILNIPVGTVKSRLSVALQALRHAVPHGFGETL